MIPEQVERQRKWDLRFLDLAKLVSSWSKDPSTQTGAVLVSPDMRVISVGFNGFPRGVSDNPARYADRELKYAIIVHCERNAMLFSRESLVGSTLYTWPFMSCSVCAAMGIQAGIKRHVAPWSNAERWVKSFELTETLLKEAGVELVTYRLDESPS
jgi:dCMP deaminase